MSAIQQTDAPPPEFKPFVPAENTGMAELTPRAVIVGAVLGLFFAASSTYLGLKVGLTVSASIPVAVLSITLFKWLGKATKSSPATILENNIVQTTGSAGESIAAGLAFTLPSLLLMGYEMEVSRILLVGLLGGLIGVLMMIPLRHGLIVKEHGKLMYPEGTACADVLIVGERGGTSAATVFLGFFVGLVYAVLNLIVKLWAESAVFAGNLVRFGGKLPGAQVAFEVSPPMLGVGYIIGTKVACTTMAGGALAYLVLVPLIHVFGDSMTTTMYPASTLIRDMSTGELRNAFILYIGAGAVATGGFIGLARSIPTIISAFAGGLRSLQAGRGATGPKRTEHDLSMRIVLGGSALIIVAIALAPILEIDALSAILIVLFGFFFVTVSSRITGEIGSSSNPISGMTIATLLITCGLFVLLGRVGVEYKAMALTTAALVCVAASNGGTISQDLKTGYLVGGTPRHQQVSILVGVVSSALLIGFVMQRLDRSATSFRAVDLPSFTATLDEKPQTEIGPDGTEYRVLYAKEEIGPVVPGSYFVDESDHFAFRVGAPVSYPSFEPKIAEDAVKMPGPDGKEYRVVHLENKKTAGGIPLGDYLAGDDGKLVFRVFEPVSYPGLAAGVPSDAVTREGPDGKQMRMMQVAAEIPPILRGKYLVGGDGKLAFAVDPSVSREYPWRLQKKSVDATVPVPADAPTELGIDRKPYKVVTLKESIAGLSEGRYLVDDAGVVAYEAKKVAKFDAPKAQLFRLIIDGTLGGRLPWGLVLAGAFLAIMMELCGVSSLPFAVGIYLPMSTSGGIFAGGIVRWLVDRKRKEKSTTEAEFSPGMLMASGLIAGGSIAGVVYSLLQADTPRIKAIAGFFDLPARVGGWISAEGDFASKLLHFLHNENVWPMFVFVLMAIGLYVVGTRRSAEG